ncbi:ATP-binding protein [Deinococcus altitudinis]|uniref:ATP-binding protein n=1 Tax=Deinococcus altitudinis TaxID=468914 RepID=UPI003892C890
MIPKRPPQANALDLDDLQSIVDGSSDCIKVLDLDGHLLSMNVGGMQTMEIEDFSSCHHVLWPEFWKSSERTRVQEALENARNGQTVHFEGPADTFLGTPRWWEVRVSPIRDQNGQITRLLAISRDVTARRTAEQKLLENEQGLQERATALELRVNQQALALNAFVRFTTAVASSTELEVLATAATDILRDVVEGAITGFFLVRGDTAYPLIFSDNTPPDVMVARRKGVLLSTPLAEEAFRRRQVVFSEGDAGQRQSVGYAAALSVVPFFVHDQPYAFLATGTERVDWSAQEQAVIESVGRGLGLALERAQQTQQLQERTAGLDAFVAFSERSGQLTDIVALARQAVDVLRATLGVVSVAYYSLSGDFWKAQVWSDDFSPEVISVLKAGIPATAPSYAEAVQTREAVFVPGWQADAEGVADTDEFGAGAFYPCFVEQVPCGLLAMGTRRAGDWTPREQAVFRAVGHSLTLALERAELAAQLARRTQQIAEDARAKAAFVAFTEAVGSISDVRTLAQQATEVLQANLSEVSVAFYELVQDRWYGVEWSNDVAPEVVAQMKAGILQEAHDFARAAGAGGAVFSDGWDPDANHLEQATRYGAAAFLPIFADGKASRMLAVGKRRALVWTEQEQAVVRAVGRGLGLAVGRTDQARLLTEQRDVLDDRSQELEAINAELEAFTYSASHDLRTPVRHVMGFAELAEMGLENGQYDKTAQYLGVVKQGALRMTALIDGMLLLSRSGRQTLEVQTVALAALVTQAQRDAEAEFAGQPVRWEIGALPVVQGDPGLLQQVMTNLLSNAVKYSSTRPLSEVQVWAEERNTETEVFVKDNGVGFDPRYADKLFGIFQRLHTEKQFAGTGVGLATVRRVVRKHGGQVAAYSQKDDGAIFSFTLPSAGAAVAQARRESENL